jgi:transporter family-2 protein
MRLDYLALICGFLIALQARVNGELSRQLGNSLEAAFVSFSSGLIIILIIALFHRGIRNGISKLRIAYKAGHLHWWNFIGGALGGFLIAIQTYVLPIIGVAIFSVGSIAGQTATSLLVDRLGITGGGKKAISMRRVFAAVLTIAAVFVSVLDRLSTKSLSIVSIVLVVMAGSIIGFQRALNGKINEYTHQSYSTSFLNFIMGTGCLGVLLLFQIVFGRTPLVVPPLDHIWMYTGGVIGILYIAFAATVVQHLGVLTFTLFSVGGQLLASLVLDLLLPTTGTHVGIYLVTGIVMTYLGVIAGGVSSSRVRKPARHR